VRSAILRQADERRRSGHGAGSADEEGRMPELAVDPAGGAFARLSATAVRSRPTPHLEETLMHRIATAVSILLAAAALAAPGSALGFPKSLCSVPSAGELTAANISGACKKLKTTHHVTHTPLGDLRSKALGAAWGDVPTSGVGHHLAISVTKFSGSAAALAEGRKRLRAKVLAEGSPVGVGSTSEWHGETASCPNPPTDDCTVSTVSAIVHNSLVAVSLIDFPTGGSESQANDDAEDLAQEEADKGPVVAIANTIAKKL
jgi:hypothetical protein